MDLLFVEIQAFGKRVYEKDVKPVLEDEDAKPKALKIAINTITNLHIVAADKGLVELLERERLGHPDEGPTVAITAQQLCQQAARLANTR